MNQTLMRNFEIEMQRQMIFEIAVLLVALIVSCWLMYWVLKCAIRDGIRESGLVAGWAQTVARANAQEPTGLPEIKR